MCSIELDCSPAIGLLLTEYVVSKRILLIKIKLGMSDVPTEEYSDGVRGVVGRNICKKIEEISPLKQISCSRRHRHIFYDNSSRFLIFIASNFVHFLHANTVKYDATPQNSNRSNSEVPISA